MNTYVRLFSVLFICFFILMACSNNEETSNKDQSNETENNEQKDNNEDEPKDDNDNAESSNNSNEEEKIDGEVIVDKDESMIRLEAETNLLEGTKVEAILDKAYGEVSLDAAVLEWESTEVESDGTISLEYPLDKAFFDKYHGEDLEFLVEVKSSKATEDTYGADGEKFSGPFVYRYNSSITEGKKLIVSTNFTMGDDQTEYRIEAPERKEKPEDYGDTAIWIDAEVADNDQRYLYVEGETNLLEGTKIRGRYFPKEDTVFTDGPLTQVYVQPDGTFRLPVNYDSITEDGYIEVKVESMYSHRTKKDIAETYGSSFENITGDLVEKGNDRQEILLTIDKKGIDIDTPKDSMITEADGELIIEMPDAVLFDFDESELKEEAKETLDDVIDILGGLDADANIQIKGHTDNEGEADYNLDLSEERAIAVEAYIKDNGDLGDLSMETKGYGQEEPIASNADKEGREKNRRVEIVFDKND